MSQTKDVLRQRWSRRELLSTTASSTAAFGLGLSGLVSSGCASKDPVVIAQGSGSALDESTARALEARLQTLLEENRVPGCAAGLIRDSELIWSQGFGYADLDSETAMTPDTLLNIGSVTKTVTTTAVLQLIERGGLDLDNDVMAHVSFPVRNPRFPDEPITIRQLLTHRSSILDGDAYDESYACGDRVTLLGDWLAEYFSAPNLENHFHQWAPGEHTPPAEPRAYSNVAFGLLGHVIEVTSGLSYEDYCRREIFEPLGMTQSGFRIDRIDTSRHAVPYTPLSEDFVLGEGFAQSSLPRFPVDQRPPVPGEPFPHCLYSFATPPDGLLRTSVNELARFLLTWIGKGTYSGVNGEGQGDVRLLRSETIGNALSEQHLGRALCWSLTTGLPGEPFWNHGGGDPGIATLVGFRPEQRSGVLLIFNVSDPGEMFRGALDALVATLDGALGPS